MKIPYQLVSMITILRDYLPYEYQDYRDDEHEKLSDIADSLYADTATPDQFKGEYQTLYKKYGPDYFAKVLEDMSAIDSQLTTDEKVDELYDDYEDRLKSSMSINSTTKIKAATNYDTKIISKYLKTLFDDEAFGTSKSSSLNSFYGNNPNDPDIYMNRNGLSYNRRNNTIDLIGKTREEDIPIYKVIPQYSSTKKQGTYAPKMPKLVPIEEWNATHGITASSRVLATEDNSYANHLIKISYKDAKYALSNLNKSHKTVGMGDAGDPGYYVSEFEEATPGYMWASDKGLQILADAAIKYELVQKVVENSKKIKASDNPFYDKLSDRDKRFVKNTEKKMADNVTTIYGDYDTTLTIDMWYGDKFVPRKYGADASVYGNGEYRGHIYDDSGKIIGDYTSDNSVLIEDNFLIDFGA